MFNEHRLLTTSIRQRALAVLGMILTFAFERGSIMPVAAQKAATRFRSRADRGQRRAETRFRARLLMVGRSGRLRPAAFLCQRSANPLCPATSFAAVGRASLTKEPICQSSKIIFAMCPSFTGLRPAARRDAACASFAVQLRLPLQSFWGANCTKHSTGTPTQTRWYKSAISLWRLLGRVPSCARNAIPQPQAAYRHG